MGNMLTAKMENFAQAIVDGLNQSDAYRHAYQIESMKAETVWARASELARDSKVAARIQELRGQITTGKAWDFEKGMGEIETNNGVGRLTDRHDHRILEQDVLDIPFHRTVSRDLRLILLVTPSF